MSLGKFGGKSKGLSQPRALKEASDVVPKSILSETAKGASTNPQMSQQLTFDALRANWPQALLSLINSGSVKLAIYTDTEDHTDNGAIRIHGVDASPSTGDVGAISFHQARSQAHTAVTSGDVLGMIKFHGADGTDSETPAVWLVASVPSTETVSTGKVPGSFSIYTSNSTSGPESRFFLNAVGKIEITPEQDSADVLGTISIIVNKNAATEWATLGLVTKTNNGALSNNNTVGAIYFRAGDAASTLNTAATIRVEMEQDAASNDTPARIEFATAPDAGGAEVVTERMRIDSKGNVIVNTAAIATSATDGFLYIPSCAGTPTGTPTTYTGRVPMVYDSTNNRLYIYDGGWISTALA